MSGKSLTGRDLISLLDFTPGELRRLLSLAAEVKANPGHYRDALAGRTLFMYFEKPSLRTRVTFEAGMTQLGGHAIYYSANDGKIGVRESVEDVARNLERWVDGAMCRTFSHSMVQDLARFSSIPIINGLTDLLHPCQALADYLTLREVRSDLKGTKLTYLGDGNNVAHSLMFGGARLGVNVTVITPRVTKSTRTCSTWRARRRTRRERRSSAGRIRRRSKDPTRCTRTFGPRWVRRPRPPTVTRSSGRTRSTRR